MAALPDGPLWMLGCGNMGGAMLRGWIAAGLDPRQVTVIKPNPGGVPDGVLRLPAPPPDGAAPAILVLGIKPQKLDEAAPAVAPMITPETLVISMLAGAEIDALRRRFPQVRDIVRVMPNTPVGVGLGVLLLYSEGIGAAARAGVEALMRPLGLVEWFDDKAAFDAASALSGCGPAFLFRFVDALEKGGEALGLPADQSARLALATVEGAAALAASAGESPAVLADRVASPGGMTREGLNVLDAADGLNPLLERTLAAAVRRSEELAAAARAPNN